MKITLINDFHNTSVTLKVSEDMVLSKYQVKKVRKALCGMDDCCCGNDLSQLGFQEHFFYVCGEKAYPYE